VVKSWRELARLEKQILTAELGKRLELGKPQPKILNVLHQGSNHPALEFLKKGWQIPSVVNLWRARVLDMRGRGESTSLLVPLTGMVRTSYLSPDAKVRSRMKVCTISREVPIGLPEY
jgi:hypothetical protein